MRITIESAAQEEHMTSIAEAIPRREVFLSMYLMTEVENHRIPAVARISPYLRYTYLYARQMLCEFEYPIRLPISIKTSLEVVGKVNQQHPSSFLTPE